tara:strand:+ start:41 stop:295 length:255 start_codon:yes stop_codon:yes gene_type:complete
MKYEDYKNQDNEDLVIERVMIKSQITSLIRETETADLPKLKENKEMRKLQFLKSAIEDELIARGSWNERGIDMYERSLYERGLI